MKSTAVKKTAFICAFALSSLFLACLSLTKTANSPIDAEAQFEAEKFWATQVTKCGDSYYRKEILPKKDNYIIYFQIREPEIVVTSNKVSESDRLNGIEWKGRPLSVQRRAGSGGLKRVCGTSGNLGWEMCRICPTG